MNSENQRVLCPSDACHPPTVSQQRPGIMLAFGPRSLFDRFLFALDRQFEHNPLYKKSVSRLNVRSVTGKTDSALVEYELSISTKYYENTLRMLHAHFDESASLNQTQHDEISQIGQDEPELVEAMLVLFNTNDKRNKNYLKLLNTQLESHQNSDKMLKVLVKSSLPSTMATTPDTLHLIKASDDDDDAERMLTDFCDKHEFSSFELNLCEDEIRGKNSTNTQEINSNKHNDEDEEESDDEFDQMDELINSFLVHNWSTMKLKSTKNKPSTRSLIGTAEAHQALLENNILKPNNNDKKADNVAQKTSGNANENDDYNEDHEDEFENILMNVREMRTKADKMSFDDRKKYAEEMVKKFWLSIGGDEDELGSLSSEDDEVEKNQHNID
jgi:hypothetical protein